jgi:hypothetical protein
MLEGHEAIEHIDALRTLFADSIGQCPVRMHVRMPDMAWVELALGENTRVIPDERLLQGIEVLLRRPNAVKLI